jgi:hypothetical protein
VLWNIGDTMTCCNTVNVLVNMERSIQVPYRAGKILTSYETIAFFLMSQVSHDI